MSRNGFRVFNVFTCLMITTVFFLSLNLNSSESVKLIAKQGVRYESLSGEPFTGIYEKFSDSNVLLEKATYKEGKKDGYSSWYSETGELTAKRTYKEGKLHGRFEDYYENGQLKQAGTYENQKKNGIFRSYHNNGNLKKDYVYRDGLKNGSWKEYYESGQVLRSGMSLNGVDQKVTLFDRDGGVLDQYPKP